MYRAWVSPEVTYENTVWGKLRKQGDTTYAWHVLPHAKYLAYTKLIYDLEGEEGAIRNWNPEKPIEWRPGEKEAHDELTKHMSLSFPLADGWEAYDLNFVFGSVYRLCRESDYDCEEVKSFPGHLRRSFTEIEYDSTSTKRSDGFLEFKIRKR